MSPAHKFQLPPLPWLRAFEASARRLSFTDAGAELNLTQAAISKQVKLLEYHLREALFERRPRSLILTKAGAAYLPKVQDAFTRLEAGTQEVFGNRTSDILTLRIALGFSLNWLAARLPRFMAAHPKLQLRVISSIWSDEEESERYDLDVRYGLPQWPGYQVDRLTHETMFPLCPPAMAVRLTHTDALASERLLHVLGYQEGWANWLQAAGATRVNSGTGSYFDNTPLALAVAAHGGGVALGRRSMTMELLAQGQLVKPFALEVPVEEGFFLLTPEQGEMHPGAEMLRQWLLSEAEGADATIGPQGAGS